MLLLGLAPTAAVRAEEGPPAAVAAVAGEQGGKARAEQGDRGSRDALAWAVEGYVRQEARLRTAGGETDLDLYTNFLAGATRSGPTPLAFRVNGRVVADVAGDERKGDLLRDVWDGFDHDVQARIYEAYGQAANLFDRPVTLRGGRQFLDEGVYLHFDGVRLDVDLGDLATGLDLSTVFGVPVKFGEGSRNESWLAGLVGRYRLDEKTRLRLEYYHVSEFFDGINDPVLDPILQPQGFPSGRLDDDLFGLSAWRRLGRSVRLFARFTLLNGDANELHLRIRWNSQDGAWTVVGELYELFGRLQNVTNDLTPFVPMLGSFEPFVRIGVRATYRHGEAWVFQGGFSHRALEDRGDESTFNHEYNNYHATASRVGLHDGRVDITLTLNGYSSSRNDVVAVGGHADFRVRKDWTVSGGVDYSLYKYDFFLDTEHEDVWSYAVRLRWRVNKKTTARARLSIDNDRFETFTTLAVSVGVRF